MKLDKSLDRFLDAQEKDFSRAIQELANGRKQGHWIWYIFPQISGLGFSSTSVYYAIRNLDEAEYYLKHPVLGQRLIQAARTLLEIDGKTANQILGSPDDLKVRSSMTLFNEVQNSDPVFRAVLDKFYGGNPDTKTLEILKLQNQQ